LVYRFLKNHILSLADIPFLVVEIYADLKQFLSNSYKYFFVSILTSVSSMAKKYLFAGARE